MSVQVFEKAQVVLGARKRGERETSLCDLYRFFGKHT